MDSQEVANNSEWMIKVYPFGVLLIGVILNFVLGVGHVQISIPSREILGLMSLAAILGVINHSWIMSTTELTRHRYKVFASPEEWRSSGRTRAEVTEEAAFEIERQLNTHRNTTENIVYFIFVAILFSFVSPNLLTAGIWILMFPLARLGYTYSYFSGNDNARGVFMTLTLLSVYGMASYLFIGFVLK